MNRWIRFAGIVGLVLLIFGMIGGLIVDSFESPLVAGHLILGVLLLIVWFFGAGASGVSSAGAALRGRSARFGANVTAYAAVFTALIVALNWVVYRHDKRFDLTEEGVYSLAPASREAVEKLEHPIKIVGLILGDEPGRESQMRDLFALYKAANVARVSTDLVDPQAKPHLVQKFEMKAGNVVYIEYGEPGAASVSRLNDASEESITNAIVKLTRGQAKKIYIVQGHGEPDIEGKDPAGLKGLAEAIADEHLTLANIIIGQRKTVPDDAAAVLLVSPKKPLLPEEKATLISYVEGGGRLLLMTDPRTTNDVSEIAAHFKIEVGKDVIIDQIQRLFAAPALGAQPLVTEYTPHPLTRAMSERTMTVYNIASSVRTLGSNDANSTWTDLAKTGLTSWAERNLEQLLDVPEPSAVREPEDLVGPVTIAAAYEHKIEPAAGEGAAAGAPTFQKVGRLVVFGDSDWVLNGNISVYSNRDFVLNTINWLAGEEGGVTIRPRQMRVSLAPITSQTFAWILALSFLVPEMILIVGLVIWWRRRTASAER